MGKVDKVTIRLTEEQASALDFLVENGNFKNRSEAIRTSIDQMIDVPEEDERMVSLRLSDTMLMTIETLVSMEHFVNKELGIRELIRNGLDLIDLNKLKSRQEVLSELGANRSAKDLLDAQYQNMLKE